MSVFNLNDQNNAIENKIVAGLDRISQVFKILLWEKSKSYNLTPIQIQLLLFINYHDIDKSTVSYLANEFNVSKPTISDTIKTLLQKQIIKKIIDPKDTRSYKIELSDIGKKLIIETENFVNPLLKIIEELDNDNRLVFWECILKIIQELNKLNIITVQRTCINCSHFSEENSKPFCKLLKQSLESEDIRIDCPEFHPTN